MADLSVFGRLKTKMDFDREAEEFDMRRQDQLLKKQLAEAQLMQAQKESKGPANVQEWQYYSQLAPQEQEQYLRMKRADQIMNLGGSMGVRNPMGGGLIESYQVTPEPEQMPGFKGAQAYAAEQAQIAAQLGGRSGGSLADIEAAKKSAELEAAKRTEAQLNYPKVQEQGRQVLDVIRGIEKSPGLGAVVGMPNPLKGGFGIFNVPGTSAADFQAKLNQLGGKQFLEAFESLKGGGQITQIEGEKATNAIARMQTSQSEKAFREALSEFKDIVLRAQDRAASSAGITNIQGDNITLRKPSRNLPRKGDIVDGYMFNGGDPANQSSWKKVR